MQHLPRTGMGVLVTVLTALTLSGCAGACRDCQEQMAMLSAAAEANAAAVEAAGQAVASNSEMIASGSSEDAMRDAELRRMVERAMAMSEQNRAGLRALSEKIDRMFATMSRK